MRKKPKPAVQLALLPETKKQWIIEDVNEMTESEFDWSAVPDWFWDLVLPNSDWSCEEISWGLLRLPFDDPEESGFSYMIFTTYGDYPSEYWPPIPPRIEEAIDRICEEVAP
jgi:hypothetical protein